MNPLSDTEFKRLRESIDWSNRQLEFTRRKRVEAVKQLVGSHYSDGGADKCVPTNFIKLATDIHIRLLAARAPRALITTLRPDLRPTAANLELRVNQIPDEIDLTTTFRKLVAEAIFSMGIVKIGLHTVGKILGHEYGQTFVDLVTIDDYFCDMAAKQMEQIQYEGNDYWLDYKEVMESDMFPKAALSGLKADEYTVIGERGEDRAEGIFSNGSATLFKDKIWLRDVWLPSEELVVTYAVKSEKRLNVVEWEGPERGPYKKLGFSDVPGNLLPLPPVAVWRDIHELANALFRKLANQADGQKTVLGFPGGNDESVIEFRNAKDNDGIKYKGGKPEKLTVGGIDPTTLAFYLQCRDLYSYFADNLDSLGGLGPQTKTVGQDRLISEAANAQLRDMASKFVDCAREVFRAIAWYEWNDPVSSKILEKPVPGTDLKIRVPWNRDSRKGSFDLYDLQIDVYSLQDDSPALQLQRLNLFVKEFVLPLAPLIQQQGGTIDVQTILRLAAKYADFKEGGEIVVFTNDQGSEKAAGVPGMPQQTTRTYERVNRPGATEGGKSQILQQALLGGNPQKSEMESLTRSTE
ncbi:MAG: hypothetical protein WC551_09465 [Patescibacteria group bacterium]